MDILIMAGQLMLSLMILVTLHELGHFMPARWFNTRVEKFYLFFDPWFALFKARKVNGSWSVASIFNKNKDYPEDQKDATEYGIGWLPLGGYVKIAGMIDESMDTEQMKQPPQPWEFRSKPAWQRLIIMLGGVTVNFILGFLLYAMVLWVWGEAYLPSENVKYGIFVDSLGMEMGLQDGDKVLSVGDAPFVKFNDRLVIREIIINNADNIKVERDGETVRIPVDEKFVSILSSRETKNRLLFGARTPFEVDAVAKNSPAEQAGLQPNDRIIGFNEVATPYFTDFQRLARTHKNQEVTLTLLRNQSDSLQVALTTTEAGTIGVMAKGLSHYFETRRQEYSLAQALPLGVTKGLGFLNDQLKAFGQMFKGRIKVSESLGGLGSIGGMFGGEWVWERFWLMTAILSLILAFMNLLPIPALDGGHVMFLLYEMVSGRKPSDKFLEYATTFGFILVLGLIVYANGLDIWNAIKGFFGR
ncbi:MAG TPA: RIP metalloprotease RseP [Saprospiraceae bacterium]|nr:RIP metalloprotease RseP [Saprospiraceae bacterium]HMP23169.1 RIP metalloprotease RseP [Saprospiraceae bacterium]